MKVNREIVLSNTYGLHARSAMKFVDTASSYAADVRLCKDGECVDGKTILDVLSMAAARGEQLRIETEGDDAEAAADALEQLVNDGFGEG